MTSINYEKLPKHVAIIMDGNGRWAKNRALNRIQGHRKGVDAVREIVKTSRKIGISWLTLYAFSEENWSRPQHEVQALWSIMKQFIKKELAEMMKNGIRLQAIGKIDKIPDSTREVLNDAIEKTKLNKDMTLTLALSYGGRQEILDAFRKIGVRIEKGDLKSSNISKQLISDALYAAEMPDPDLLIRTSGEYRVSNFLLWQISYSEMYFTPVLWPDFNSEEYLTAINEFQKRERRFGTTDS